MSGETDQYPTANREYPSERRLQMPREEITKPAGEADWNDEITKRRKDQGLPLDPISKERRHHEDRDHQTTTGARN